VEKERPQSLVYKMVRQGGIPFEITTQIEPFKNSLKKANENNGKTI